MNSYKGWGLVSHSVIPSIRGGFPAGWLRVGIRRLLAYLYSSFLDLLHFMSTRSWYVNLSGTVQNPVIDIKILLSLGSLSS